MRPSAALSHLSQLARLGLPSRTVIPDMLDTLAQMVPSHFCMFVWVDRFGRVVDFHLPWLIPSAIEVNSALLDCDDMAVPSFASLVRGGRPFGFAAETCRRSDFQHSLFYNECCLPYGIGHGFDVFVRDGREVRGVVLATREPGHRWYNRREIDILMSATPAFAHALAADNLHPPTAFSDSDERAVLTLDLDGHIVQASGQHEIMLRALLGLRLDNSFSKTAFAAAATDYFAPLVAKASRTPLVERLTPYGRILIRFYPCASSDRQDTAARPVDAYYALIERQIPLPLQIVRRLAGLDLSPRERQVAQHLVLLRSPDQIMNILGIGAHTLHDYRRRIYRRTGVSSRDELVRQVLG